MTVTEYYTEVNKKMTLLINKTIMAKVQELESNNFRAQFANRFNRFKNENKYQGNNLRFDKKRQNINTNKTGNYWNNDQNYNWPQKGNFWQNDNHNNNQKQQAVEPMDVVPSIQLQNKPSYNRQPNNNWQANNNRGRYNNNYYQNNNRSNCYRTNQNREQTQAQNREPD